MSTSQDNEAGRHEADGVGATPSPCTGLCQLDQDQVCTGCGRSIVEIARWRHMTEAERDVVMERLQRAASNA